MTLKNNQTANIPLIKGKYESLMATFSTVATVVLYNKYGFILPVGLTAVGTTLMALSALAQFKLYKAKRNTLSL